jgi:hypothetical protein
VILFTLDKTAQPFTVALANLPIKSRWQSLCCKIFMPALSNWNVSDRRVSERLSEKLSTALGEATAAFPQERWQSWKFQIRDQFVELLMGEERGDETIDSDWRERIIHCGAALQSLKLSLKRLGCSARMKLFPELERPFLVARVYFREGGTDHEPEPLLFDLLTPGFFRPAAELPMSDTVLNLMSHTVAGERCWLEMVQCQKSRERLLELAQMNEQWLFQIAGARPVVPSAPSDSGQKPAVSNGWQKFIMGVKLRAAVPLPEAGHESDVPAISGTFAVLKTKTDDKYGWIEAGQTSALLLVTARKLGVSCAFFNQALRQPSVRQELRTSIGHKGFCQAIVQLKTPEYTLPALAGVERPAARRVI